jgi:hypothetical protein
MADPKEFRNHAHYRWLKKHLAGATSDLLRLHEVGTRLEKLVAEKPYGANAVEKLSQGLGKSVGQLSGFRKFAQQWTRSEIERFVERANRQGTHLTWHHFRSLLGITSRHYDSATAAKRKQKKLIGMCIKEGWNTRQMQTAVQEELGRKKDERTLAKPDDFKQGLEEFIQHSKAYLRRCDEVWFGAAGVISANSCPKKLSSGVNKLRREGQQAAQRLRSAIECAEKLRKELPRSRRASK